MEATKMAAEATSGEGIDVAEIGRRLGLGAEASRELAACMRDLGWAHVSIVASGTSWLELTYQGHLAIRRMREEMRRPVRRWVRNHPELYPIVVWFALTAGAVLVGFGVTKLLESLFQ